MGAKTEGFTKAATLQSCRGLTTYRLSDFVHSKLGTDIVEVKKATASTSSLTVARWLAAGTIRVPGSMYSLSAYKSSMHSAMATYTWFRLKKDKKGGDKAMDILDRLQAEDGYVRLVLTSCEVVLGRPDCVVYEEDDEGYDTVKLIRFEPWNSKFAKYFTAEEIASFDTCQEADIPPAE